MVYRMDLSTLAVLFALLLLLAGLSFVVMIDPYIRREHRRIMLIIAALSLSLIIEDYGGNLLFLRRSHLVLKSCLSAFGYSVRPVILILYSYIIRPKGKKRLLWVLAGINAALNGSSPLTGLCFTIRETDFVMLRGPLWFSCMVVSAFLLAVLFVHSVFSYRETRRWERLIPLFVVLAILASVVMDLRVSVESQPISFLNVAIVVGSVFYYIWLHLQFVREHERDLTAEQRIQIMMTQIQPHFLYNTLSTIQALCSTDPQQAAGITGKFSAYLRQNLNTLEIPGLTSFEKELEHTRTYADIERVRFPNIRVEYAIEDSGFSLPPLTVQPIVENAIRHGVRIREEGVIRVVARKAEGGHEIVVSDNGIGFDVTPLEQNDGTHIGLKNVQERIEKMCGGSVTVVSQPDMGTTVTVFIPEREEEKA